LKWKENRASVLYIDEFMRGMRDDADAWRLAGLCKRLNIRLVGVSDGFHLDDEDWDTKVRFYNLVTHMETKYKQQRVRRGMAGAATSNRVIGKLPLGYTRRVLRDSVGRILMNGKDQPLHERCIDSETKDYALRMFTWVMKESWTPFMVARKFNELKVEGWDGWSVATIIKILVNPAYIGLFIWNRTKTEYNYEAHEYEIVHNRWTEWERFYDKKLAVIPKAWHVTLRKRFDKGKAAREPRPNKSARCPSTLFSEALRCGYCGTALRLYRSTQKYSDLYCPNGPTGRHQCQLRSSKAARVVEEALLRSSANRFLPSAQ
jgi:DNA invertase Pin-like site-specific DNA recombinase